MIRLLIAVLISLFASNVVAMEHYTDVLRDNKGVAIKDATVSVYLAGTTTFAQLFSDNGMTPKANPTTTSHDAVSPGAYDFYAANGVYDIVFVKTGYSFSNALTRRIALFDLNDGGGGGGSSTPPFSTITAGTNSAAAMVVGTGSSLNYTASGTINASSFRGNTVVGLADGGTNQSTWTASRCVHVNAAGTALEVVSGDCLSSNPAFGTITTGSNNSATMTVGSGAAITFSGSGAINANQFKGNATVAVADGGTGLTTAPDDAINVGNGSILVSTALPSCSNATTSKLLYNTSTNAFSCGTDQSTGGGTTFDSIGTGTNVTATMTCGTGCSLLNSGTGLIVFTAGRPNVTTVNAGNSPYSALNTDFEILCDTTAAGRIINLPAATSKAFFRVKNLGSNSCTINRNGTDLIDGDTSAVLRTQYEAVDLVADTSANWEVH